jgi:hypothetical protein
LVSEAAQLVLKLEKLGLQTTVEGQHIMAEAFAALGVFGGGQQVGEAGEARVEIVQKRIPPTSSTAF